MNTVLVIVAIIIASLLGEGLLVLKNRDMKNYDVEMWRYAKILKQRSKDPILGHEHIPNKEAVLQGIKIRINNMGLRGKDVSLTASAKRRILVLGASATLGWGVAEEETFTHILDKSLGPNVEVLNAGIGNYNTVRYVELFLTKLYVLKPTDILIHFYQNDVEVLHCGGGNWLLRNSQFAVTLWRLFHNEQGHTNESSLVNYYKNLYTANATGFQDMEKALDHLAVYTKSHKIHVYFSVMPDFITMPPNPNDLSSYPFEFIHRIMREEAEKRGFNYIDLLPAFRNITNPQTLWVMPTDPHPNALAHKLMANYLLDKLQDTHISLETNQ